jgi:glucokinase
MGAATTTTAPAVLLGIDIGGTKIAGGLVDAATGGVLLGDRVPTGAAEGGPAVLARALDLARGLLARGAEAGLAPPAGVGVGAGGQIDPAAGEVVAATEVLPGWAGTPLRAAFADALRLPAAVDNDVNALAAGEMRWGAGRGLSNVVFLALGTGVGGALVLDGRLHHGARGAGGEPGHLILVPDGLPCTCGGRGCLEQYTSGPALWRHYQALGGEPDRDETALAARARQDPDGPAARAVAWTGNLLGVGLVSLANLFGPERILIGGGLAALGDLLLDPARRVLRDRALPGVRDCPVVPAALGPDAGIAGAAAVALAGRP